MSSRSTDLIEILYLDEAVLVLEVCSLTSALREGKSRSLCLSHTVFKINVPLMMIQPS